MSGNKKKIIGCICFFIFSFILLGAVFSYLTETFSVNFTERLSLNWLLALLITLFIAIVYLVKRYSDLIRELNKSLEMINNINNNAYITESEIKTSFPAVSYINRAIREISKDIHNQVKEINERSIELDQKNSKLDSAYKQLEESYTRLQTLMEQLNESEQRYHSLVISIPDIVLTLDGDGNITYANRACRDILNFRRHDIVGKPFQYIVHGEHAGKFNFEELKQTVEKNGEQLMQIPLRKKDGTFIEAEIKFTPALESPHGYSIQAIIRDITDQKRMERDLVEYNRRLKIINEFSQKIVSNAELTDIHKNCARTLTEMLGFSGAVCFFAEKKDRYYSITAYSGEYFSDAGVLDFFSKINPNHETFSFMREIKYGIVLDFSTFTGLLAGERGSSVEIPSFEQVYIQELNNGDSGSGFLLVITRKNFKHEEIDVLRSICNTTAVAVENAMHLIRSKKNYVATIDALIAAVEARDQYTRGHSQRVASYAVQIAEEMGLSKEVIEDLRIAGILHDIGKIGISDRILLKKGPLTKEEYEEIKKHPAISNKILYPIGLSDRILRAIAFHHERYDGRGYPFGLSNESIGLEPQIIAVADAFDAMTSRRPYREPLSLEMALWELEKNKGSQFHPDIVDVMLRIQEKNGIYILKQ